MSVGASKVANSTLSAEKIAAAAPCVQHAECRDEREGGSSDVIVTYNNITELLILRWNKCCEAVVVWSH